MMAFRRSIIFLAVLFSLGFYFGPLTAANYASPGSDEDPLVSQKWVDAYVQKEFSGIQKEIDELSARINILAKNLAGVHTGESLGIILTIGSKNALINNVSYSLDAAPFIVSGRTMLPLRFLGEAFGITFIWDGGTKTVTYASEKGQVVLTIGEKKVLIGENTINLDVPSGIVAGRTFVPIRFIGESLGAEVIWHPETKKVEIR